MAWRGILSLEGDSDRRLFDATNGGTGWSPHTPLSDRVSNYGPALATFRDNCTWHGGGRRTISGCFAQLFPSRRKIHLGQSNIPLVIGVLAEGTGLTCRFDSCTSVEVKLTSILLSFIMSKLLGKVAVVTGGSKGIGAGIAKALAAEGASVVVNYSTSKEGADRVVDEITKRSGRAVAIQGDVAKAADLERIFAETKRAFGQLDVLVNNAGVYEFAPLEAITEEQFHRQFNTNVLGLILATREAVKYFGERGGSVINIGSVASRQTPPSTCVYTATKGAVDAVTGVLAKELGSKHIRVNSINPGFVETEGVHASGLIGSDFIQGIIAETPLGRGGQPEDIAPVAVFLASDDAHWVTGEHVLVSGGLR